VTIFSNSDTISNILNPQWPGSNGDAVDAGVPGPAPGRQRYPRPQRSRADYAAVLPADARPLPRQQWALDTPIRAGTHPPNMDRLASQSFCQLPLSFHHFQPHSPKSKSGPDSRLCHRRSRLRCHQGTRDQRHSKQAHEKRWENISQVKSMAARGFSLPSLNVEI
jgi:hypothetical protein